MEGRQVFNHVQDYFDLTIQTVKNKLNFITAGLADKLGLIESGRQRVESYRKLTKKFLEIYQKSYDSKSIEELDCGVMDLIVRHNKICEKENRTSEILSPEEIVGNMYLFQFAGSDTTFNTTTQTLCYLSQHLALQDKIRK